MKINSFNKEKYLQNQKADEKDVNKSNNINKNNLQNLEKDKTNNMNQSNNVKDVLEISDDTKNMYSIQKKIESGFYNRPDVLRTVAERIINTIDEKT
jgi:hypothetical protein